MILPGSPEWQLTGVYLVLTAFAAALMKIASIRVDPASRGDRLRFLFLAPVFSTVTWRASAAELRLPAGAACLAGQCVGLALGRRLETIHDRPFSSRSLSEFWGRRWNRWLSAWFRQVCFRPLRDRPLLGVAAAFGASAAL